MYCPTCAAQNIENAQFCRACGADLGFLSGPKIRRSREKELEAAEEKGLRYTLIGAGFLIIAIITALFAPPPINWFFCFSMLCAAFPLLGSGIAMSVQAKRSRQQLAPFNREAEKLVEQPAGQLPPRNTSEIIQPPSVTEGTTKILSAPSEREKPPFSH